MKQIWLSETVIQWNKFLSKMSENEGYLFGSNGRHKQIPTPLLEHDNVSIPTIVIADPAKNRSQTACIRWFGEVRADKEKTNLLERFQYLFPIIINPFDEILFPPEKQRIENCQVISLDSAVFFSEKLPRNKIQIVCYEINPLRIIHASIVLLAFPWFGLIQPKWYADPARNTNLVKRIKLGSNG